MLVDGLPQHRHRWPRDPAGWSELDRDRAVGQQDIGWSAELSLLPEIDERQRVLALPEDGRRELDARRHPRLLATDTVPGREEAVPRVDLLAVDQDRDRQLRPVLARHPVNRQGERLRRRLAIDREPQRRLAVPGAPGVDRRPRPHVARFLEIGALPV